MAELNTADTTTDACCAPAQQATCCEPSARSAKVEEHRTTMLGELRRKLDLTQAVVADRLEA
jgi:hypothetical protein